MTRLRALLLAATLAIVSAPALAQNDQHMMGNDHGQGMTGDDDHGQGTMGDHGQGMMGDDNHGEGTMGDHDQGMMGNDHGMSGHDGQ